MGAGPDLSLNETIDSPSEKKIDLGDLLGDINKFKDSHSDYFENYNTNIDAGIDMEDLKTLKERWERLFILADLVEWLKKHWNTERDPIKVEQEIVRSKETKEQKELAKLDIQKWMTEVQVKALIENHLINSLRLNPQQLENRLNWLTAKLNQTLEKSTEWNQDLAEIRDFFTNELMIRPSDKDLRLILSIRKSIVSAEQTKDLIKQETLSDQLNTLIEKQKELDSLRWSPQYDDVKKYISEHLPKIRKHLNSLISKNEKHWEKLIDMNEFQNLQWKYLEWSLSESEYKDGIITIKKSAKYKALVWENTSTAVKLRKNVKNNDTVALNNNTKKQREENKKLSSVINASINAWVKPSNKEEAMYLRESQEELSKILTETLENPEGASPLLRNSLQQYKEAIKTVPEGQLSDTEKKTLKSLKQHDFTQEHVPNIWAPHTGDLSDVSSNFDSWEPINYKWELYTAFSDTQWTILKSESSIVFLNEAREEETIELTWVEATKLQESPEWLRNVINLKNTFSELNIEKLWNHREWIMQVVDNYEGNKFNVDQDYLWETEIKVLLNNIVKMSFPQHWAIDTRLGMESFKMVFRIANNSEWIWAKMDADSEWNSAMESAFLKKHFYAQNKLNTVTMKAALESKDAAL